MKFHLRCLSLDGGRSPCSREEGKNHLAALDISISFSSHLGGLRTLQSRTNSIKDSDASFTPFRGSSIKLFSSFFSSPPFFYSFTERENFFSISAPCTQPKWMRRAKTEARGSERLNKLHFCSHLVWISAEITAESIKVFSFHSRQSPLVWSRGKKAQQREEAKLEVN